MVKKVCLGLILVVMVTFSGCDLSDATVSGDTLREVTQGAEDFSMTAEEFADEWPALRVKLVEYGLDPNDFNTVEKFRGEFKKHNNRLQEAIAGASGVDYSDEPSMMNWVLFLQSLNKNTGEWNDYKPWFDLSLRALAMIIPLLAGGAAVKVKKDRDIKAERVNSDRQFAEVVDGLEDSKDSLDHDANGKMRRAMKANMKLSPDTREKVAFERKKIRVS